ncbi:LysR substrate-binding domain-containing protein [Jiella flava]|nr:LysR substrate-binding domain-containing protein [Jiella flava]
MKTPRRFLPSIGLLSAFEAAARTGSFTAASVELDLTQSAVSRQIRSLEEQLGVELFLRERQTVRLTAAGEAYAVDIREALRRISTASLNLRANPLGGTLNLAILPTFGTRWLSPRLPDFLQRNRGITLNLMTRLTEFDFHKDPVDAAIHFGSPQWPGTDSLMLMTEDVIPAASPELLARYPAIRHPSDILEMPLLHIASRPDAWEQWFAANAVVPDRLTGMLFDQFATIAQAAMSGLGVALLPTFLIEREIKMGDLVPLLDRPMRSRENYYLIWPRERANYPPLVAFRNWLAALAALSPKDE